MPDEAMVAPQPPSPLRVPVTVVVGLTIPPLAPLAWILLSGARRAAYWRSPWLRLGLVVALAGTLPLLLFAAAGAAGLLADPNPNPVGLGLLGLVTAICGTLLMAVGTIRVAASE